MYRYIAILALSIFLLNVHSSHAQSGSDLSDKELLQKTMIRCFEKAFKDLDRDRSEEMGKIKKCISKMGVGLEEFSTGVGIPKAKAKKMGVDANSNSKRLDAIIFDIKDRELVMDNLAKEEVRNSTEINSVPAYSPPEDSEKSADKERSPGSASGATPQKYYTGQDNSGDKASNNGSKSPKPIFLPR